MNTQNVIIEQLQKNNQLLSIKNTFQYQEILFDLGLAYEGVDIQKVTQYSEELKNCQYEEVKPFAQVRGHLLETIN